MSLIYRHPITGGKIFQAGRMEIPGYLRSGHIHTLILSAKEFQPVGITSVETFRVRLVDSKHLNQFEIVDTIFSAEEAAKLAATRVMQGKNVLITCHAGLNRSGLIVGLTLKKLTAFSPEQILQTIRKNRWGALFNPLFVEILKAV